MLMIKNKSVKEKWKVKKGLKGVKKLKEEKLYDHK